MNGKRTAVRWVAGLLVLAALFAVSCASPGGIVDGKLAACPKLPNCVCSDDESRLARIEPLPYAGGAEEAWDCLQQVVKGMVGATIQQVDDTYLWATYRSRVFRFVDDVEFRLDAPNQQIQVRSASRIGLSDLGANRRRINAVAEIFHQELAARAPETRSGSESTPED